MEEYQGNQMCVHRRFVFAAKMKNSPKQTLMLVLLCLGQLSRICAYPKKDGECDCPMMLVVMVTMTMVMIPGSTIMVTPPPFIDSIYSLLLRHLHIIFSIISTNTSVLSSVLKS